MSDLVPHQVYSTQVKWHHDNKPALGFKCWGQPNFDAGSPWTLAE